MFVSPGVAEVSRVDTREGALLGREVQLGSARYLEKSIIARGSVGDRVGWPRTVLGWRPASEHGQLQLQVTRHRLSVGSKHVIRRRRLRTMAWWHIARRGCCGGIGYLSGSCHGSLLRSERRTLRPPGDECDPRHQIS